MELRAELTDRNGLRWPLRVRCEPQGELRSLVAGLAQLREQVSALLGPLVEQESASGDRAGRRGDEEDEDDQDEDEEENQVNVKACPSGPPLKRTKTNSS
ncbi:EKC/KEOPS complex subunit GON7 [Varanus komodoensis]|uniref:EKC/KEOPS complex subunit GON7 n=1 Tax=Varanus komodoensis TaxID=61221 RepID=UPI001CF7D6C6|nr:EKC/KEOPS complex subunit GON7 [Varanus komodoensis]KAF7251980.1 EKC/KEOPS complex subunit GON7 [Varanus komodoensis]